MMKCEKQPVWRVVLVGSGNVAAAYARALPTVEGVELVQIYARNEERGRALAALASVPWCGAGGELAAADLYIVAVSDRAIGDVCAELRFPADALVVHTAGSVAMEAIAGREGRRGVLYAFQSFTAGRDVDFSNIPIFVEADNEAVEERLKMFATRLSNKVYTANSERRRMVHLAGVIVNNFTNHLYTLGGELLRGEGFDFELLAPLIAETAAKAIESANPHSVQTGPAIRGDRAVCAKHVEMLASSPELQRIYNVITDSIWEISKKI
jgi:predicted short-subunit dehydrogenase-like oxidoreductase (DUF2520 family)